jgi:TatA/E family protein of Tat protein translocase
MGHIVVLVAVIMLLLGYRRFSDLGGSLGSSIRAFKKGMDEGEEQKSREVKELGSSEPEEKT